MIGWVLAFVLLLSGCQFFFSFVCVGGGSLGFKLGHFTANPTRAALKHRKKADLIAVANTIGVLVPVSAKKEWAERAGPAGVSWLLWRKLSRGCCMMFTALVLRSPLLTPQFLENLYFSLNWNFCWAIKRLNLKEPDVLTEMIIRSCWRSALYWAPPFSVLHYTRWYHNEPKLSPSKLQWAQGTQGLSKISSENLSKVIVIKWTAVAQNGLRNAVIYVSR